MALGISLVSYVVMELNLKLGEGMLKNLIVGRYQQPRAENRIFLFIDLNHSMALAEELGEIKYSHLLQDFFYDLSDPISRNGGEVYQYVGDEVVVTWPMPIGFDRNRCVHAVLEARVKLHRQSCNYLSKYCHQPDFKAGMHCGTVIVAEVGKVKSDIAYHGVVINTAARIRELCNEMGADFLISSDLQQHLQPESTFSTISTGAHSIRGRKKDINIFRVVPTSAACRDNLLQRPTWSIC